MPNFCAEICQTLYAVLRICGPEKAFHPVPAKKPSKYVNKINF